MKYFESWESFVNLINPLLDGLGVTLTFFILTLVFALPLGLLLCFGKTSKIAPLRWFCSGYILLFRGTPLLLQLIFFFFGLPVIGITISREAAVVVAFSLNYAAYFAEIYRGGLLSISRGQYEAAQVLGLKKSTTFAKIILPQIIKRILPPISNEIITLVKDTSLVYAIAVSDLIKEAKTIMLRDMNLMPLVVAAVFYLLLTTIFTFILNKCEKKLSYYQ